MNASAADRNTQQSGLQVRTLPISATAILFAGCLCCLDSDGYVIDGTDATAQKFAGIAQEAFDNTDGTDGADEDGNDADVVLYTEGAFRFASASLTEADIGKAVYLLDNQTVVKSGHADLDFHIYVGRIISIESATVVWVAIDPYGVDPNLVDVTIDAAGPNATTLSLASHAAATARDGTGLYVKYVDSMLAIVAASGAPATVTRKVITTHFTLASGVISAVGDESANRLVIAMRAVVKQ